MLVSQKRIGNNGRQYWFDGSAVFHLSFWASLLQFWLAWESNGLTLQYLPPVYTPAYITKYHSYSSRQFSDHLSPLPRYAPGGRLRPASTSLSTPSLTPLLLSSSSLAISLSSSAVSRQFPAPPRPPIPVLRLEPCSFSMTFSLVVFTASFVFSTIDVPSESVWSRSEALTKFPAPPRPVRAGTVADVVEAYGGLCVALSGDSSFCASRS